MGCWIAHYDCMSNYRDEMDVWRECFSEQGELFQRIIDLDCNNELVNCRIKIA